MNEPKYMHACMYLEDVVGFTFDLSGLLYIVMGGPVGRFCPLQKVLQLYQLTTHNRLHVY